MIVMDRVDDAILGRKENYIREMVTGTGGFMAKTRRMTRLTVVHYVKEQLIHWLYTPL